jgi:hypothetical protein
MNGFEALVKLDPTDVYHKTYISVDEFNAIKNKEFGLFNRTKASGLMKILKREYDLDLDDWMEEYEAYKKEHDDEKDIFVVAPKEHEGSIESKIYIYIALAIIAFFVVLFIIFPKGEQNTSADMTSSQNSIVDEAKETLQQKNTEMLQTERLELPKNTEPLNEEIVPPVKKDIFYISSKTDLWIGIQYLDTNEQENKIFRDRLELDPKKDQQLTLGHGHFTLVFNDQIIKPDLHNVHKVSFKNRELTIQKVPLPIKSKQANSSEDMPGKPSAEPAKSAQDNDKVLEPIEE